MARRFGTGNWPPKPTKDEGVFNPDKFVRDIEQQYLKLGDGIREGISMGKSEVAEGFKPEDMSPETWKPANETLEKIKTLSERYKSESDSAEKAKIAASMQRLGVTFSRVSKEIREKAQGMAIEASIGLSSELKEQPEAETAPAPEAAPEPSPDESAKREVFEKLNPDDPDKVIVQPSKRPKKGKGGSPPKGKSGKPVAVVGNLDPDSLPDVSPEDANIGFGESSKEFAEAVRASAQEGEGAGVAPIPPEEANAEVVPPSERQQRKLMKVMLAEIAGASEEEIHNIFSASEVDLSDDEEEEAMTLFGSPMARERAASVLDRMGGSPTKVKQYIAQLKYLTDEALRQKAAEDTEAKLREKKEQEEIDQNIASKRAAEEKGAKGAPYNPSFADVGVHGSLAEEYAAWNAENKQHRFNAANPELEGVFGRSKEAVQAYEEEREEALKQDATKVRKPSDATLQEVASISMEEKKAEKKKAAEIRAVMADEAAKRRAAEVDASEFAAPQYAPREMQAEMDKLTREEPSPKPAEEAPMPAVFRSNRGKPAGKSPDEYMAELLTAAKEKESGGEGIPAQETAKTGTEEELPSAGEYFFKKLEKETAPGTDLVPSGEKAEGTRKEWFAKLRETVGKFGGVVKERVVEMSERGKQLAGNLVERMKVLDAKGAELSEKYFGKLGEAYNKLPMSRKIALGTTLALGLGLTSSWIAGAYGAGLVATRFASLAGAFKGNEERLKAVREGAAKGSWIDSRLSKWIGENGTERDMRNVAMAKSLAISLGLGTGAAVLSHYHVAERLGSWIGEHVYNATHPDAPVEGAASVSASGTISHAPIGGAEHAVPPTETFVPPPPISGSPHGYEGMINNLMEKLPATRPDNIPDGSDLAKLYDAKESADPAELGRAIHRIAMDDKHGFFVDREGVRENFRVLAEDKMTVDAKTGDILFNGQVHAPGDGHMIPEHQPEAPPAPEVVQSPPEVMPGPDLTAAQEQHQQQIDTANAAGAAPAPEHAAASVPPLANEQPLTWRTGSGGTLVDSEGHPVQAVDYEHSGDEFSPQETGAAANVVEQSGASATPGTPVIEHLKEFVNPNKLMIDPLHGHVFQDSSGAVVAYGNDFAARLDAAQEFAKAHPDTSVFVQAENPVLVDGVLRPYVFEVRYGGFLFKSMHITGSDAPVDPSHIGAIDPDAFVKQLDK